MSRTALMAARRRLPDREGRCGEHKGRRCLYPALSHHAIIVNHIRKEREFSRN